MLNIDIKSKGGNAVGYMEGQEVMEFRDNTAAASKWFIDSFLVYTCLRSLESYKFQG